jgi:hypothetical protein
VSILRFTFSVPAGDSRIEQAKTLIKHEKAVADFRKALGTHSYNEAIVTPRGPKQPAAKPAVVVSEPADEAAE